MESNMKDNMGSRKIDLTQKGTGWVPSLFDTNDYTLKTLRSEEDRDFEDEKKEKIGRVETIGEADQIDKLTAIINRLLQLPVLQDNTDIKDSVEKIRQDLNSSIISIEQARIHKLLKIGDRDVQILRVKDLLKSFLIYFPTFRNHSQSCELDLTSLKFDDGIQKALQDFYKYLTDNELLHNWFGETPPDNIEINIDIMTALYTIVKASENVRDLHWLAQQWLTYIEECKDDKKKLRKFREEAKWKDIIIRIKLLEVLSCVVEEMRELFLSNKKTENHKKYDYDIVHLENVQKKLDKKFEFLEDSDEFKVTQNVSLEIANLPHCAVSYKKKFVKYKPKEQLYDAINSLIEALNLEERSKNSKFKEPVQPKKIEEDSSPKQVVERILRVVDGIEGMVWELWGTTPLPLFPALFTKKIVPVPPPIPAQIFDLFLSQLEKRSKSEQWCSDYPILHAFVTLQGQLKLKQRGRSSEDEAIVLTQRYRLSKVLIPKISPLGGCNIKQSIVRELRRLEELMRQMKGLAKRDKISSPKQSNLLEELVELVEQIIQAWEAQNVEKSGGKELLEIVFDDRNDQSPKYHQEIVYLPLKGDPELKIKGNQGSKSL